MLLRRLSPNAAVSATTKLMLRAFSSQYALREKALPPRIVIPEADIEESFLKGSGPGGQKINKTSSAVQLKHLPTGIVVKSQETRSREQNRKTARRILGEKLEEMEKGPLSRTALKVERARKKKASASKKSRRKYRRLDEEKGHDAEQTEQGIDATSHSANGSDSRQAATETFGAGQQSQKRSAEVVRE